MSTASRIGVLALALLMVAGCVKKRSGEPAETCDRFGDAAGRCTVGAIEGVARYDGGSAHEGIRVSVVGTDRHAATAEDGSFSLEKLPPGDYVVAMEAEGWTTAFAQATVRARQATVLEAVTLEKATIATSLGGRVLLAGRTDHAGTLVAIDGTGVGVFTAEDGSFEFRGVPFGTVRIIARHAGFHTATFDVEVDRISVDAGDRTLERLPLPGSLSGVVYVAGEPLGGVAVALAGTEFETQTGPDGTFILDAVEPGTFELVAVARGFLPASREVEVASERHTVVPAITLRPAHDHGRLRGTARRLGELHHDGIEVRLLDGDRLLAAATTDEEGRYQLPEAPVGLRTLVLRAEGFPELRIPNVALGPGDWSGPDAVLRRSVLVDPRSGDGMTTPSGRKAVISFYTGRFGTHVWDGDALTLRHVLPAYSLLVAVDSDETYATVLVEYGAPANLLRLDLAAAEVEAVSPRPARVIGTFGGSTFYFDEQGDLRRIRAGDTVATRVDVEVDDAWIAGVSAGVAWIGISYEGGWEAGMRIPFDLGSDWHGPVLLGPFGPVEDRFFGRAEDRSLVWVDLVGKNTVPVSTPDAFGVHETAGGILFGDAWDEGAETFDLLFARLADGAAVDVARGVVEFGRLGPRSFAFGSEDGSWHWLSEGAATTEPICAGGEVMIRDGVLVCHVGVPGEVRVADDSGVRTLTTSAESVSFLFDDLMLAWTEPGEVDRFRVASVRTLQELEIECGVVSHQASSYPRYLVGCSGTLRLYDVEAMTIEDIGTLEPVECDLTGDGDGVVCLFAEPCDGSTWCVRAFDRASGEWAEHGVSAALQHRIGKEGVWASSGRAVAFASPSYLLQVIFPESGPPEFARCNVLSAGSIQTVEDDGTVLWSEGGTHYVCDPAGLPTSVAGAGPGELERLGDTRWSLLSDSVVIHLGRRVWYPVDPSAARWWSPDGGDDLLVADAMGLRWFDEEGETQLATGGQALEGFEVLPLYWNGDAVGRVSDSGEFVHVTDAAAVDSGPLGAEQAWFVAWDDEDVGEAFVASLTAGEVVAIARGIDRWSFDPWMGLDSFYFNGEVDGTAGFYRMSAGAGGPVRLLDRVEYAYTTEDGHTWFHDGEMSWLEHDGAAVLVHDEAIDADSIASPWDRGFLFSPEWGQDEVPGTWWFALP